MLQQGALLLRRSRQERRGGTAVLDERSGLRLLKLRRHLKLLLKWVCFLEVGQEDGCY
jgi:hypothetical protein